MKYMIAALLLVGAAGPAAAQATCDDLWYSRNAFFKEAGYCFKTTRAIRTFGNAGCQYDGIEDVPLSNRQRQEINEIQRVERQKGCPR
jgi:hypothetical protein